MSLLDLIVLSLATWQIVLIWRRSSLFASWRARVEAWDDGWLSQLLQCGWCLSVWIAALTVYLKISTNLLDDLGEPPQDATWFRLARWPFAAATRFGWFFVWAMAVSRLANLLHDLAAPYDRTPRVDDDYDDDATEP